MPPHRLQHLSKPTCPKVHRLCPLCFRGSPQVGGLRNASPRKRDRRKDIQHLLHSLFEFWGKRAPNPHLNICPMEGSVGFEPTTFRRANGCASGSTCCPYMIRARRGTPKPRRGCLPVCGARQPLRLSKQARALPTAAQPIAPLHLPPAAWGDAASSGSLGRAESNHPSVGNATNPTPRSDKKLHPGPKN